MNYETLFLFVFVVCDYVLGNFLECERLSQFGMEQTGHAFRTLARTQATWLQPTVLRNTSATFARFYSLVQVPSAQKKMRYLCIGVRHDDPEGFVYSVSNCETQITERKFKNNFF